MAGITKSYRLTADGSQVKREFGEVGAAGAAMEQKIRAGAKALHPALRAVDAAAAELRTGVQGAASAAGGLGNVLSALGPAGLGAAAGVGALILGFNQLNTASRAATDTLGEIYTASLRLNTSVEFLQEWRYAMVQTGEDARVVDATLSRFGVKLGQLATSPAQELRQKLRAFGFSDDDIRNLRTVEESLPLIADRIREMGTAAEDAALLEALGLKEMQPLLQQGSEAIDRVRRAARDMGVVLDEEVIRRGYDLGGAWDAAAYALDITFKQAIVDAAPAFISLLNIMRDMAQAASDLLDRFKEVEHRSARGLSNRLGDLGREQARLFDLYGADVTRGGNAARAALVDQLVAAPTGGLFRPGDLQGLLGLDAARDRYAFLVAQIEEIAGEFSRRRPDDTTSPVNGLNFDPTETSGASTDPRIAQARALIDRLNEEARVRTSLLALQQQFPNASREELQARQLLLDTLTQLDEARRLGVITSDTELEALRANAQGAYEYADALRVAAERERELAEIQRRVDSVRQSIETPQARLAREEAELRSLYAASQDAADPLTSGELAAGLARIREEYDKLAESQFRASLEGRVLSGIIEGQIRNFEDLARVIAETGLQAVIDELMSGGFHQGFGGFVSGVLDRFGQSVTGDEATHWGQALFRRGAEELDAAAAEAAGKLAEGFTPELAQSVIKLGASTAAEVSQTSAQGATTVSLLAMQKAALSAAAALARVGAEGGADGALKFLPSLLPKGPGKASGGGLWLGARHPVAEAGPELVLLGGKGHVFPNDSVQGLLALARLARTPPAAGAAAPPRVSVTLRDESGAQIALERAEATTGADGGLDLDLVLGRHVAAAIGSGQADRALNARFNLRTRKVRRG